MSDEAPEARVVKPRPGLLAQLARRVERYELAIVIALSLAILLPGLWSFQLIDPWETHYGEVGRRILEEDDWVHLKWQNEVFRSKPVLTFWLIAASLGSMGVAADGGYSGEMVSSDFVVFAMRLPFALFGAFGLVMVWWMLARLVNRRVAWIAFLVVATCPFYLLVARQAITDMPMVAALMGAVACFAMAVHRGDEPLRPFLSERPPPAPGRTWRRPWAYLRRANAHHIFVACLALFTLLQAVYYIIYFQLSPVLAREIRVAQPGFVLGAGMIFVLGGLVAWFIWKPVTSRGPVYLHWAFFLIAVGALAKGPVTPGLALLIGGLTIALTGIWRILLSWEWLRAAGTFALVAVPWHVAMFWKDGNAWQSEYFGYHMRKRLTEGAHQQDAKSTFDYFSSILGVGMWPWAVLVPVALITVLWNASSKTREGQVRILCGIWAIAGFALFAASSTKFHHYVLPAVPALAIMVAFWIDDALHDRAGRVALFAIFGAALSLLITRDLLGEPKQIIELFIYRYDRPWPSGSPWHVDVSEPIYGFGLLAALALVAIALPWRSARPWALGGLGAVALGFAVWAANGYMGAAAPHWGQRELHRTYYAKRTIHGVEIKYWSLRDLADQWEGRSEYRIKSVLPDNFKTGLPMTVRLLVPGAGVPDDKVELKGQVSRIGDDEFSIAIPPAEQAKLADLIARGKKPGVKPGRKPWVQVDADRLLAWQLNWRGENFWSSGEIWGETPDTRTVFINTNNEEFLKYVKEPAREGRTFFVVTEAPRANGLKNVLPTKRGKSSVEILDTSCNKFTLLRFTL
jgi:4-amino-4-deoxy-L-arabinose transferase-like glycosyltransferase